MVTEIERLGLRQAWLTMTPQEATEYLAELPTTDTDRFAEDAACSSYMEGLAMLAHMHDRAGKGSSVKLVIEKAARPSLVVKAILTKPSEAPAKKAPPPPKSSQRKTNTKGKVAYRYDKTAAQKNPKRAAAKAAGKKPQVDAPVPARPDPAPRIDVAELARVLQTPEGTLKQYASGFKDAQSFVSYASTKLGPFIRKHNIGPDKLRRLWEQLAHG